MDSGFGAARRPGMTKGETPMTFAGINVLAVVVAAVAAWLVSAGWYMSLGRIYQAALGKTPEECKLEMQKPGAFLPFVVAFVGNLVIGWMLAGVLGHLGAGQVTFKNGVITGAFLWFGFILTTMVVNYCFSGRDKRVLLIDLGNWLLVLVVIGAVIGAIGV
jgi:Protein of unknown function (DUF1761)